MFVVSWVEEWTLFKPWKPKWIVKNHGNEHILRSIAKNLQETEFITVMIDECADITNKEQVKNVINV